MIKIKTGYFLLFIFRYVFNNLIIKYLSYVTIHYYSLHGVTKRTHHLKKF